MIFKAHLTKNYIIEWCDGFFSLFLFASSLCLWWWTMCIFIVAYDDSVMHKLSHYFSCLQMHTIFFCFLFYFLSFLFLSLFWKWSSWFVITVMHVWLTKIIEKKLYEQRNRSIFFFSGCYFMFLLLLLNASCL